MSKALLMTVTLIVLCAPTALAALQYDDPAIKVIDNLWNITTSPNHPGANDWRWDVTLNSGVTGNWGGTIISAFGFIVYDDDPGTSPFSALGWGTMPPDNGASVEWVVNHYSLPLLLAGDSTYFTATIDQLDEPGKVVMAVVEEDYGPDQERIERQYYARFTVNVRAGGGRGDPRAVHLAPAEPQRPGGGLHSPAAAVIGPHPIVSTRGKGGERR